MPSSPIRWTRIALWLVAGTLLYNCLEAAIAMTAGLMAQSIALVGFGLDSLIEVAAGAFLLWRLRLQARGAARELVERAEKAVGRFIAVTFIMLALYVVLESATTLWTHEAPHASWLGIVLASVSLVVMPVIAWGKLRAATEIGSTALRAEAKETLACSYLSFALLVGLLANALMGWWWADPAAALLMVPWLVKEGVEGLRGEEEEEKEKGGEDTEEDDRD